MPTGKAAAVPRFATLADGGASGRVAFVPCVAEALVFSLVHEIGKAINWQSIFGFAINKLVL